MAGNVFIREEKTGLAIADPKEGEPPTGTDPTLSCGIDGRDIRTYRTRALAQGLLWPCWGTRSARVPPTVSPSRGVAGTVTSGRSARRLCCRTLV